jgi:membrane-bound metal-dependent hydrolase YbcI (DUF457 family)
MGPGVVVKAILGRHFSLTVFGFAQVAIDLEPLVRMARGDSAPHGLSHTYVGATVIGFVSLFAGRPACQWLLRLWPPTPGRPFLEWLRESGTIPWPAAVVGAFVGTYSHILLDSIMHAEMQPLWPVSDRNALLDAVSMEALHVLCFAAGVLGLLGIAGRYWFCGRAVAG